MFYCTGMFLTHNILKSIINNNLKKAKAREKSKNMQKNYYNNNYIFFQNNYLIIFYFKVSIGQKALYIKYIIKALNDQ